LIKQSIIEMELAPLLIKPLKSCLNQQLSMLLLKHLHPWLFMHFAKSLDSLVEPLLILLKLFLNCLV